MSFGLAACALLLAGIAWVPAKAETQGIAAVVNDEPISGYDLQQRLRLVVSSSGLQTSEDMLKRIEPQILRSLVEERLEIQEAVKQKIRVDDREVDQALINIARQNNMNPTQIRDFLGKSDIDVSTLRDQIRANIAWQKLVSQRFGPRIYISDEDIKSEQDRLTQSIAQPQFLVSEIVLRIESPDQDEEVHNAANRLEEQLHQGAPFPSVAQQFSQSSTAATGGDLGWVLRSQLAAEVSKELDSMSIGQLSKPIRTPASYRIVYLRNKREAGKMRPVMTTTEAPQVAQRPIKRVQLKQVMMALPAKATEDQVKAAQEQIEGMRGQLKGCSNADELALSHKMKVMSLPMTNFGELSPIFQQLVMATPDGGASQPFKSSVGVHVLIVCKKEMGDAPKEAQAKPAPAQNEPDPGMPGRDEIEGRLYNQQLSMMSRRYLRDLRRDAVVEYRTEAN